VYVKYTNILPNL